MYFMSQDCAQCDWLFELCSIANYNNDHFIFINLKEQWKWDILYIA